jgi:hypothetical protein
MADTLSSSDLQRVKFELGFNQLNVGAEPYLSITRAFEQVIVPNLNAGELNTSTTLVPATAAPTPVVLQLQNVISSITLLDHVLIDVDDATEYATVVDINTVSSPNTITVRLTKAHGSGGTGYPVNQEGGVQMVRFYLQRCRKIADRIDRFGARAGVKKADEMEFFGGAGGRGGKEPSGFKTLSDIQQYWRSELCMLLFGVGNLSQLGGGVGNRVGVY